MENFVSFLKTSQNRDRIFDRRLVDHNRLKTTLQSGIFFDIFSVLVERGRADAMQFAPRKHRLQEVARVHSAVRFARADYGMKFVDEQNDFAFAFPHFVKHGFEPFLELAAEFRSGDKRADIQREQFSVLKVFRNVAFHYSYGKSLGDCRFTDARLTDKHGIVLRFSRKDTDDVSYFVVSADNGIEFSATRLFHEFRAVFVKHVVSFLGVVARHSRTASHLRENLKIIV